MRINDGTHVRAHKKETIMLNSSRHCIEKINIKNDIKKMWERYAIQLEIISWVEVFIFFDEIAIQ